MHKIPCRDLDHAQRLLAWLRSASIDAEVAPEPAPSGGSAGEAGCHITIAESSVARYEALAGDFALTPKETPRPAMVEEPAAEEPEAENPTFLGALVYGAVGGIGVSLAALILSYPGTLFGLKFEEIASVCGLFVGYGLAFGLFLAMFSYLLLQLGTLAKAHRR